MSGGKKLVREKLPKTVYCKLHIFNFVCTQYSLFRFDASSHALSISSYLREREQRHELAAPVSNGLFVHC